MKRRLFLIRHGAPEGAWGGDLADPGLSALGRAQARAAAGRLAGPLLLVSSPMRRCRETAAPAEQTLGLQARIEPRVSEVQAPAGTEDRRAWLAENFPWADGVGRRTWRTLSPGLHDWRAHVLAAAKTIDMDTAIFTHFIAINAIVGAALGREATIVCRPDHASITELAVEDGALRLIGLGVEMNNGEVR